MKLTTQLAQAAIAAAIARAGEIKVPMNIAVLDAGGHLKSFVRMDGAVLGSIDIAMKKAKTAVLFEANSEAIWEYCKPGAPAPRAGTHQRHAHAVRGRNSVTTRR